MVAFCTVRMRMLRILHLLGVMGRRCPMEAEMLSPLNLHAVIHPGNNCRALTCYGPLFFTGDHQEKAPWTVVRAQWRTVHVLPSEALNTSALLPCSWGVWSGQGLVDIPGRVRWIHLAKKGFSAQRLWGPGVLAYGNKNRLRCQFKEKSVITPKSSDFLDPRRRLTGMCTPRPSLKISRKLIGSGFIPPCPTPSFCLPPQMAFLLRRLSDHPLQSSSLLSILTVAACFRNGSVTELEVWMGFRAHSHKSL